MLHWRVVVVSVLYPLVLTVQLVKEDDGEGNHKAAEQESVTLANASSLEQFWALASFTGKDLNATNLQAETWQRYRPCGTCSNFTRFGEDHDGGYLMCDELLEGTKALYSYGINGYDGWGAALSNRLNVDVQQYDCFHTKRPACPDNLVCHFHFHDECVATKTSGKYRSFAEQLKRNNHPNSGTDLVMKMDIEGAEWEVLADEANKPLLAHFSQLVIEFHQLDQVNAVKAQSMKNLLDLFVVVHVHGNNCGAVSKRDGYSIPTVLEVTFVRRGLASQTQCQDAPTTSVLDSKNCKQANEALFKLP